MLVELVLAQESAQVPAHGTRHPGVLAFGLVIVPRAQLDLLLAAARVDLGLSAVPARQPVVAVDEEVLDLSHHGPVEHQLPRVAHLKVHGTADVALGAFAAEGVAALDRDERLAEDFFTHGAYEGLWFLYELYKLSRHAVINTCNIITTFGAGELGAVDQRLLNLYGIGRAWPRKIIKINKVLL